jgi:hypothetical protein
LTKKNLDEKIGQKGSFEERREKLRIMLGNDIEQTANTYKLNAGSKVLIKN